MLAAEANYMNAHFKQRAVIAIPLGATLVAAALMLAIRHLIPGGGIAILLLTGYVIYLWGCAALAKAKGYTAAQGVLIGIVLTAFVLLVIPDRSKLSKAQRDKEDRADEEERRAQDRPLTGRQKVVLWLLGLFLGLVGLAIIVGYEVYWARVVVPEREGMSAAISVSADKPDPYHDGQLVHVTGALEGDGGLADPDFGVTVDALRLRRRVWMRQWEQGTVQSRSSYSTIDATTHKETTLLKTRTYNYTQVWSEKVINSRSFFNGGHDNPTAKAIPDWERSVGQISLGGFAVAPELVKKLDDFQDVPLSDRNLDGLPPALRAKAQIVGGKIYVGADPQRPAIGDLKIEIEFAPKTNVTVLAQQNGKKLVPYAVAQSGSIAQLRVGTFSVHDITAQLAQRELRVRMLVWVFGGFAMLMGVVIIAAARKQS